MEKAVAELRYAETEGGGMTSTEFIAIHGADVWNQYVVPLKNSAVADIRNNANAIAHDRLMRKQMTDKLTETVPPSPVLTSVEKLTAIATSKDNGQVGAIIDVIALIISVLLPLIQSCFASGSTPISVANFMKSRPVLGRALVYSAMRKAGVYYSHPQHNLVYDSIVEAGKQATAADVSNLIAETCI